MAKVSSNKKEKNNEDQSTYKVIGRITKKKNTKNGTKKIPSKKVEKKNEENIKGKIIIEEKAKKQIEKEQKMDKNKSKEDIKKEKKTKVNKALLTILLLLLAIVIILGIVFGGKIINETKLKKEIKSLSERNIDTDDFSNIQLVTSGQYGIVEKRIKEFYSEYSSLKKEFMNKINDEKIQKILTVENYKKDGPDFVESLKYIELQKEEFNKISENIETLLTVENISKRISEDNLSEYYKKLYENYFFDDGKLVTNLQETYQDVKDAKNLMNNLYDNEIKILNFLIENKEHWKILNEKLTFDSATLSVEYNTLKTQLYSE